MVKQLTNTLSVRKRISYNQGSNSGGDKISKFVKNLAYCSNLLTEGLCRNSYTKTKKIAIALGLNGQNFREKRLNKI